MIANWISLLSSEILKDRNFTYIRLSYLIVIFNHLSLNFEKYMLTQTPKCTFFSCFYWGRSWWWIYNCKLSKKVSLFHYFHRGVINLNLHLSFMDNEKHACGSSLLKNILSDISFICFHGICKFSPLLLGEFKEQKMLAYSSLNKLELSRSFNEVNLFNVFMNLFWGNYRI